MLLEQPVLLLFFFGLFKSEIIMHFAHILHLQEFTAEYPAVKPLKPKVSAD
jgi:hypothetical protein